MLSASDDQIIMSYSILYHIKRTLSIFLYYLFNLIKELATCEVTYELDHGSFTARRKGICSAGSVEKELPTIG